MDTLFTIILWVVTICLWLATFGALFSPIIFAVLFGNHFILMYLVLSWIPALFLGIVSIFLSVAILEIT